MFYVNNVKLNLQQTNYHFLGEEESMELETIAKRVKNALDEIKKEKKACMFLVNDPNPVNSTGELEPHKSVTIPLTVSIVGDYGVEEWTWTKHTLSRSNDKLDIPSNQYALMFYGDKVLDPRTDFELIYFLRHISPSVKKGLIYEYNPEKVASDFFAQGGNEANLKLAIKNILDKETVDGLARAWGIANPDLDEINTVKKRLYEHVIYYERNKKSFGRGIDEFLSNLSLEGKEVQDRALVQRAFELQFLVKDIASGGYYYSDGKGTLSKFLYKPLANDLFKGQDAVYDYLSDNVDDLENLKRIMRGEDYLQPQWTEEKIKKLNWNAFRRECPVFKSGSTHAQLIEDWVAVLEVEPSPEILKND